jgi:hypothetical protein
MGTVADGPTGCGELEKGRCLVAWKFTLTKSIVFMEAEGESSSNTLSLLAYC